jgi:hypothetical protein
MPSRVEDALDDMLRENFIRSGVGATRKHVAELAKNACASLPPEEMHTDHFCVSARFVDKFFARRELVLRKPHPERRTEVDPDHVHQFIAAHENAKSC